MPNESYLNNIVKGASFVLIGLFLGKLISYGFRIIIARGLGSQNYGTYNLGIAIISILWIIALIGLDQGIIRYVAYFRGKEDYNRIRGVVLSAVIISIILSIFLSILLFIFSDYIALTYFSDKTLAYILKILAISIPLSALSKIFLNILRATQNIKYMVLIDNILGNITRLLFGAIVIYFGLNLTGIVWVYNLSIALILLLSIYYVSKKVKSIFNNKIKPIYLFKKVFNYSWPLLLTALLYCIINWTDSLMVGYFKKSSFVGIYNAATPTASLILIIPLALISLFLPITSYLMSKDNKEEIKNLFNTITRWIFTVSLPLTLLLIIFSKQMIKFFFGSEYILATVPLMILAIGQFTYSNSFTSTEILKSIKKTKFILFTNVIAALLNISLNVYLIPIYGLIGAAIATTSSYIIRGFMLSIGTYMYTKLIPFKLEFLKPLIFSILLILPFIYLLKIYSITFYTMIPLSILFLVVYCISLVFFKLFKQEDYILLKELKSKIVKH